MSNTTFHTPSDNVRPDAPNVEVMLIHGRTLYYWLVPRCPYCGAAHQHGGGYMSDGPGEPYRNLGHRCSHCADRPQIRPGREKGYNLVASTRMPVAARVERGHRACPRFATTTCPSCRAAQRAWLLEAGTLREASTAMRGRPHDCTKCGARLILGRAREIVK